MKIERSIYFLFLLALSLSVHSVLSAQSWQAKSLRGVKTIDLSIRVEPSASKCGITEDYIKTEILYILGNSNIKIGDYNKGAVVTPNANAKLFVHAYAQEGCSWTINYAVRSPAIITRNNVLIWATIWEKETISSDSGNVRESTTQEIDDDSKELVVDWDSANK